MDMFDYSIIYSITSRQDYVALQPMFYGMDGHQMTERGVRSSMLSENIKC